MSEDFVIDLEVRDQHIPVTVDRLGHFSATFNTRRFEEDTLEKLRLQLMVATKRAKAVISVPFELVEIEGYGDPSVHVKQWTVVGRHAANGDFLVVGPGGTKDRITDGYRAGGGDFYRVLTPAERQEIIDLTRAARKAASALTKWQESHKIDLRKVVDQAISAEAAKE